jgi:exopolysaccharide biosynthesis polyprenyl glycosylphosphotransferase
MMGRHRWLREELVRTPLDNPAETTTANPSRAASFQQLLRDPVSKPVIVSGARMLEIPASRQPIHAAMRGRGWIMRRALLSADVAGILAAGLITALIFGQPEGTNALSWQVELAMLILALPLWVFGAYIAGLYGFDEDRANHSTADDLLRVFVLCTSGAFMLSQAAALSGSPTTDPLKTTVLWGLTITLITVIRSVVRGAARRTASFRQKTLVIGAGRVGQLLARKLKLHPEYGLDVVGFVDDDAPSRASFLESIPVLGGLREVPDLVARHHVQRVLIAYSRDQDADLVDLIRRLRDGGVQVDVVPRYFEVVGPRVDIHTVEGLSLVGLPPVRLSRSASLVKRTIDVIVAGTALLLLAPLMALIALLIRRDSPGPVLFRQMRLGKDMEEFRLLKFRTMRVDTDDSDHREYIKTSMGNPELHEGSRFKLSREDAVTRTGAWLRKTSLDELPQLINVLKGDMSLVGPRPCLHYEVEHFATHHFERFLVPAGLTGLWQVSARAQSTFAEALDMDVLYAQSASLGLDIRLMLRTPLQLLRSQATA